MKIMDLPRFNRPNSKLLNKGAGSLDTAELLSIIFGVGSKGESALELSNRLLKKYNLHRFEDLGFNELVKECRGKRNEEIGDHVKAMKILSLVELSKRYNKLVNKGYKRNISCAKDVYDMFADEFRNYKKEVLNIILLDTKNKIISIKEISVGTLNSSLIHPREIFKEAIKESANSIILVHNHPSGDPKPSEDDIKTTKQIIEVGKIINIPLVDHVILGKDRYWNWLESKS